MSTNDRAREHDYDDDGIHTLKCRLCWRPTTDERARELASRWLRYDEIAEILDVLEEAKENLRHDGCLRGATCDCHLVPLIEKIDAILGEGK